MHDFDWDLSSEREVKLVQFNYQSIPTHAFRVSKANSIVSIEVSADNARCEITVDEHCPIRSIRVRVDGLSGILRDGL